ncbi:(2Fe-2S)-binding protein [Cupriavidus basilensis]
MCARAPNCPRARGCPRCSPRSAWKTPIASAAAGPADGKGADAGLTVCSCLGVGRNTICPTRCASTTWKTPAEVTACVKAGGNCGSCVPELKKLLAEIRVAEVA